jgi:hypothetical protein
MATRRGLIRSAIQLLWLPPRGARVYFCLNAAITFKDVIVHTRIIQIQVSATRTNRIIDRSGNNGAIADAKAGTNRLMVLTSPCCTGLKANQVCDEYKQTHYEEPVLLPTACDIIFHNSQSFKIEISLLFRVDSGRLSNNWFYSLKQISPKRNVSKNKHHKDG